MCTGREGRRREGGREGGRRREGRREGGRGRKREKEGGREGGRGRRREEEGEGGREGKREGERKRREGKRIPPWAVELVGENQCQWRGVEVVQWREEGTRRSGEGSVVVRVTLAHGKHFSEQSCGREGRG